MAILGAIGQQRYMADDFVLLKIIEIILKTIAKNRTGTRIGIKESANKGTSPVSCSGECLAVKSSKRLTCDWVIHTVSPSSNNPEMLKTCYQNILAEAVELNVG